MFQYKSQFKYRMYFMAVVILFAFFLTDKVFAAELFFEGKDIKVRLGDQFDVKLFLDAVDVGLNAVEGTLSFPVASLDLKEIHDGNSLISFWLERPRINSSGQVHFSGIIPGGYTGKKGAVISMVFEAKKEGSGIIEMNGAKVLQNDGMGTPVPLSSPKIQFSISKKIPGSTAKTLNIIDIEPPETFSPEVAQHPDIFDGRYFLAFTTQDKGSGMSDYAIYESKRAVSSMDSRLWDTAESPYLLKDQQLGSYIYVKAVDNAGNERVITLPPRHSLFLEKGYLITLLALAFISVIILKRRFFRGMLNNHRRV